ncbi:YihY/virulence factor BrkB family protein [Sciscionella sediminilitoris]|uniref:YihY/virulence factor BrkB family protein n=1 Tax=Sciscionella sediminilitoris TaxID=1445613 RepID=UPI0005677084|nr:YihY/virulence factor BrkB family protein [Sciscionella sp. SE31]
MGTAEANTGKQRYGKRAPLLLVRRTLLNVWHGNIFSEAAKAAFWQTLSLPPLLLGVLGSLGLLGKWVGRQVVTDVESTIINLADKVFTQNVVTTIIKPTVEQILTTAQGEVASVGFLISLWAGSSAMAAFVDSITSAYGQYGVRNDVWQRIYALLLYLAALIVVIVGLPIIALGPTYLPSVFPNAWSKNISELVGIFYYPVIALLLALALTTLYKLALPRKLPWHRGLPGAVLAMVIVLLASIGLRIYISIITRTGYSYGALAAPIAFLLFTFFIGIAIVAGANLNAAIQTLWPAKPSRRSRKRWKRLADYERVQDTEVLDARGTGPDAETAEVADPDDGEREPGTDQAPQDPAAPGTETAEFATQPSEPSSPPRGIPS